MYIPYINCVNLLIWIYNWHCMKWSHKAGLQSVVIMLASMLLPLWVVDLCSSIISPDVSTILKYLLVYGSPLMMSWGLIRLQARITEGEI